jgi:hypothetical protein
VENDEVSVEPVRVNPDVVGSGAREDDGFASVGTCSIEDSMGVDVFWGVGGADCSPRPLASCLGC